MQSKSKHEQFSDQFYTGLLLIYFGATEIAVLYLLTFKQEPRIQKKREKDYLTVQFQIKARLESPAMVHYALHCSLQGHVSPAGLVSVTVS